MAVYELPNVRPYASAGECEVKLRSHDEIETLCQRPSKLTRLNVHMTGWQARVNGVETPIRLEDETFQGVDVPAGAARIVFDYAPPGLRPALGVGGIALFLLMGGFALGLKRRYRSRGQNSADETPALP